MITSVGLIGAGVMGQGIAAANLAHGISVTATDADDVTLQNAPATILADPALLAGESENQPAKLLRTTVADSDMHTADLVIEAVVEKLAVKKQVLARLEPLLSEDALLASNTSSVSISKIAAALSRPEQFCGLHFCYPVSKRNVVEVVRGEETSDLTLARAVDYVRSLGKEPILVQDGPGFLINRLLMPYMNEAIELILDGADVELVESAARQFGMPMGPLRKFDAFGIDVTMRTGAMLYKAFSDRVVASDVLIALFQAGRLGEKTGEGFFSYETGTAAQDLSGPARQIFEARRREVRVYSHEELTLRLFLPMLLEATRALQERIVADVADVDRALRGGLGFEPPTAGLLGWADSLGMARILELLKPFEQLGQRYHPTPLLMRMAADHSRFADFVNSHPADELDRTQAA